MNRFHFSLFALLCLLAGCQTFSGERVTIYSHPDSATSGFAVNEISAALETRGYRVETESLSSLRGENTGYRIVLFQPDNMEAHALFETAGGSGSNELHDEGFKLSPIVDDSLSGTTVWIMGNDPGGVMYGGLEAAEQLALYSFEGLSETVQNPRFAIRGTKFNIPLDARTPSYSDMSDVAQENIDDMWDMDFWTGYIDELARHRYNLISLWNLHPFPSMVRVPEYPDIALDDVMKTTAELDEYYSTRVVDIAGPAITDHLETVVEMSMDEKIVFWQQVMQYARDRNIDFYLLSWNIYTYGTDGKYGLTDDYTNQTTIDYFRRSIKAMFDTYPLLSGVGVTTGENFGDANFDQKEDWVRQTYGQALIDAATENPDRQFTFVHRLHETGVQSDAADYADEANVAAVDIANRFGDLLEMDNMEFLYSFKYAQAHIYSSTRQSFHEEYIRDIAGMKTLWTLRNDDVYYFRWGAPDFVREFIQNMYPGEEGHGIYLGSDQYIWGREFLSKQPVKSGELEIEKHWYQWMLWGRLGYNPELTNVRLTDILKNRYPGVEAPQLFRAWQEASMIYPVTTGFHWGVYDFHWYIEASKGRPANAQTVSGFHDVNRFITLPPHPESGYASIPEFVEYTLNDSPMSGISPVDVSGMLHEHADNALSILDDLQTNSDEELRLTIEDIRTMAYLGKHYAHKIAGATELALFRSSGSQDHQLRAVNELRQAAQFWRLYASSALTRYYNPLWTNRVGHVNWREMMRHALNDIVIAGGQPVAVSTPMLTNGTVLEAEDAGVDGGLIDSQPGDYSGTGYINFPEQSATDTSNRWIVWTYDAAEAGDYYVEIRYAIGDGEYETSMSVNGSAKPVTLWTTGGEQIWASDRIQTDLVRGENRIRLEISGAPLIDKIHVTPVW